MKKKCRIFLISLGIITISVSCLYFIPHEGQVKNNKREPIITESDIALISNNEAMINTNTNTNTNHSYTVNDYQFFRDGLVYKTYAEGIELNTGDEIQADISEMDIIGSCTPVLVDYKNETVEELFLSSAKRITYTIENYGMYALYLIVELENGKEVEIDITDRISTYYTVNKNTQEFGFIPLTASP